MSIPEALIGEILLILPLKSLLRCCAVCKSWNSLIKSSAFGELHLRRTIQSNNQNNDHLLLHRTYNYEKGCMVNLLRRDNPALMSEHTEIINPFEAVDLNYNISVGICNGLVCLKNPINTIIVWNPCIKKYLKLPSPSPITYGSVIDVYAFGYVSQANDYKVLRTVIYHPRTRIPCAVEVWSLSRGSWNTLTAVDNKIPPDFQPLQGTCLVNDVMHWVQRSVGGEEGKFIVGFDMKRELFCKIVLPPDARESDPEITNHMLRYGETFALLMINRRNTICMWVMKEYGVAESWTKSYTIPRQEMLYYEPLCFRKSGELIIGCSRLVSLDFKSGEVLDICGYGGWGDLIEYFVESLVLLGHPNAISY